MDRIGAFHPDSGAVLNAGRWCNANVFVVERDGQRWIVKDFTHCRTPVRQTWGVWMTSRELRALRHLDGIPGVPSGAFPIDRHTFGYRFVAGHALNSIERGRVPTEYFEALEESVRRIHERGIAHLDLRNRRNILVTNDGKPVLVDFQSHIRLDRMPRAMRRFLEHIDLSGVYKYWAKLHPESLGPERAAILARAEQWRWLWPLRGYAGVKRSRPQVPPASAATDGGRLAPVHALFNHAALRTVLTRLRIPLGIAGGAFVLAIFPPRAEWYVPALAVSISGALVQAWCFGSLHKKRELACRGPYAFVRNPMYLARFFLIGGALLLTGQPWILLPYAILYYFYMVNRVKREEATLAPIFGERYAHYCAEVRRFWPRRSPYLGNEVAYFRWHLFRRNNAHWNLLGVLGFYAAVAWFVFLAR